MKYILFLIVSFSSVCYGQTYECDNNYEECGNPNQSGGGGGGGGSVLINNTDLGDSYQHADDFDDDGIEDSSDNCMRVRNPDQLDRDGDGFGDSCDNCLNTWNSNQNNSDGDDFGDACDDDDDNDGIEDYLDECPFHWGLDSCFLSESDFVDRNNTNNFYKEDTVTLYKTDIKENHIKNNCNSLDGRVNILALVLYLFSFLVYKKSQTI